MKPSYKIAAITTVVIAASLPMLSIAQQEAIGFTSKPNRCIALHQGQMCYQDIKFEWQTKGDKHYCLFEAENPQPLTCWQGAEKKYHQHAFESPVNISYVIRIQHKPEILFKTTVSVAWVYKSTRKSSSGWRLF